MTRASDGAGVIDVTPDMLEAWLDRGECIVIDVREDAEHVAERIPGVRHFALSRFDPEAIREACGARRAVFQCRIGRRSKDAALRYRVGDEDALHLAGGIEAWKATGRRTERSSNSPPPGPIRTTP